MATQHPGSAGDVGEGEDLRDRSLGELLRQLSGETTRLVHQELELAKAELQQKGKQAGAGAGMFGGAGAPGRWGWPSGPPPSGSWPGWRCPRPGSRTRSWGRWPTRSRTGSRRPGRRPWTAASRSPRRWPAPPPTPPSTNPGARPGAGRQRQAERPGRRLRDAASHQVVVPANRPWTIRQLHDAGANP